MLNMNQVMERYRAGKCPVCGVVCKGEDFDVQFCSKCGNQWDEVERLYSVSLLNGDGEDIEVEGDLYWVKHIPDILLRLLDTPEILPLFIGMDEGFDKLIAERLGNG